MKNLKTSILSLVIVVLGAGYLQAALAINLDSTYVGIDEANPTVASTQLEYQICNSSNADKQALLKFNIIGNGPNQVPLNSTISSATLRIKSAVTGDGIMYRSGLQWSSSSTWNSLGDVLPGGTGIGVGNTSQEFNVTSHVALWASGGSNQGWVIKGTVDDCAAARIYNGTASDTLKPRLTVIFTPPETTPPIVTDVDVSSTVSGQAYDVVAGSGEQLRTIPIAKPDRVFVTFSEGVTNVSSTTVFLKTKSGTTIPATVSYASGLATLQLTSPITVPTKVVLTVTSGASGVRDAVNNQLDGEWTNNPASLTTSISKDFPSGNGSAGGDFIFYFTILPGDYNRNNIADAGDEVLWSKNRGIASGALFTQGDGDGDGDVDNDDHAIWASNFGVDQTTW